MSKLQTVVVALILSGLVMAAIAFAAHSNPTITVTDGTGLSATSASTGMSSHFTASGCGFRANDASDYLVIHGPGVDTTSLTYWVDHFPVGADGCGSVSPSWSGSGVTGNFDVFVVRSPSGNPWQAQPISNVVTVNITSP
jgi:hypothetical protein